MKQLKEKGSVVIHKDNENWVELGEAVIKELEDKGLQYGTDFKYDFTFSACIIKLYTR
jgi:hypothetical protein